MGNYNAMLWLPYQNRFDHSIEAVASAPLARARRARLLEWATDLANRVTSSAMGRIDQEVRHLMHQ